LCVVIINFSRAAASKVKRTKEKIENDGRRER
jgi:hypothetical protein